MSFGSVIFGSVAPWLRGSVVVWLVGWLVSKWSVVFWWVVDGSVVGGINKTL